MQYYCEGHSIVIRPIRPDDNKPLAEIVRKAMSEFKADPKTTIIGDPALDTMYENYQIPRSAYFMVETDDALAGGCGIAPLTGGDESVCELQRMFLSKHARGLGIGKKLLELCIESARNFGYKEMYLETLSDMHNAISLYENSGFKRIDGAMGNTGHSGCNVNMLLTL
jgi:putative acetyltransferase